MFFNKTKRLRAQLIKLNDSYNQLVKDKSDYQSDNSDQPEIAEIKLSKFNLELSRISLIFEELRESYPDYTHINDDGDLWKLTKPYECPGLVYTTEYQLNFPVFEPSQTYLALKYHQDIQEFSDYVAYVNRALVAEKRRELEGMYKQMCKRNNITYSIFAGPLVDYYDNRIIPILQVSAVDIGCNLEEFATSFKSNIIKL